jgi:hypothetical protein
MLKKVLLYLFLSILAIPSVFAASSGESNSLGFLGIIPIILTIVMIAQVSKADKEDAKVTRGKKEGVAGWLLFFIGLILLNGAIALIRIISEVFQYILYSPLFEFSTRLILLGIFELIVGIGFIFVAYCLWKRKKNARWYAVVILALNLLVLVFQGASYPETLVIGFMFAELIWGVVMLLFFLISKRVKNTYTKKVKTFKYNRKINRPVIGWLVYQLVLGLIVLIAFQGSIWSDLASFDQEDLVCFDHCDSTGYFESYYFGFVEDLDRYLCRCYIGEEVTESALFIKDVPVEV